MISGQIKFFDKSRCLYADGSSATASSGNASANFALDRNTNTYWRSVSSNDTVTETFQITFASNQTLSRILLLDHNWKQFTVKYDLSGVWTDFASVVGLDGALGGGISETAFADDSAYYEFTPVTTGKILITVTKTQTANQDKYLNQAIVTTELGTLVGYPNVKDVTYQAFPRIQKVLSGKDIVQKSEQGFQCKLDFSNYPPDSNGSPDFDLMASLFDRDDNFMIWLCGGRRGSTYFKYALRGFRLRDCPTVQMVTPLSVNYTENVYINPLNLSCEFHEAIG